MHYKNIIIAGAVCVVVASLGLPANAGSAAQPLTKHTTVASHIDLDLSLTCTQSGPDVSLNASLASNPTLGEASRVYVAFANASVFWDGTQWMKTDKSGRKLVPVGDGDLSVSGLAFQGAVVKKSGRTSTTGNPFVWYYDGSNWSLLGPGRCNKVGDAGTVVLHDVELSWDALATAVPRMGSCVSSVSGTEITVNGSLTIDPAETWGADVPVLYVSKAATVDGNHFTLVNGNGEFDVDPAVPGVTGSLPNGVKVAGAKVHVDLDAAAVSSTLTLSNSIAHAAIGGNPVVWIGLGNGSVDNWTAFGKCNTMLVK